MSDDRRKWVATTSLRMVVYHQRDGGKNRWLQQWTAPEGEPLGGEGEWVDVQETNMPYVSAK